MHKAGLLRRLWRPQVKPARRYQYPTHFFNYMRNQPQPQHTQLENGLVVVTLQRELCHAAVGLFADAGTRYENPHEFGLMHLFEHLVPKSTETESRIQVLTRINDLGIKFYVKTDREMFSCYTQCLLNDIGEAVEILAKCVNNTKFNADDIKAEKNVIFEEILKQEQNAQTIVFDYLHATAFQGTGLANSIIGPSANLYTLTDNHLKLYLNKMMHPCRMCLVVVGGVSHEHVVCLARQVLPYAKPSSCFDSTYRYTGSEVRYRNDAMPKAHVAFAMEGPPYGHVHSTYIDLACVMLGGWDLSQLGGVNHGVAVAQNASCGQFCDAYKTFNIKYKDTALWGAHFVGTSFQLEDMLFTLQDNLLKMCTEITSGEFERAKEQMKSKVLNDTHSCAGLMKDLARYMLYSNCFWPALHERVDFIEKIPLDEFKKVIYEYVYNKCPVVAAVGPTEGLPEYNRIRSSMYWVRL